MHAIFCRINDKQFNQVFTHVRRRFYVKWVSFSDRNWWHVAAHCCCSCWSEVVKKGLRRFKPIWMKFCRNVLQVNIYRSIDGVRFLKWRNTRSRFRSRPPLATSSPSACDVSSWLILGLHSYLFTLYACSLNVHRPSALLLDGRAKSQRAWNWIDRKC